MKAVYYQGNVETEIECDEVREGDTGVYLLDDLGDQLGYILYENLRWVVPSDENE